MKDPELSSGTSGLHSDTFLTGRPLSAHAVRELARQANYQASRSGPVYRWQGQDDQVYAPSRWSFLTPQCSVPVVVAPGTRGLRCAFRATIASGRRVSFAAVATPLGGTVVVPAWPYYVTLLGTGSSQRGEVEVPCPPAGSFLLTLFWRAEISVTVDPVVSSSQYSVSATFEAGAWASPTVGALYDRESFLDEYIVSSGSSGWYNAPGSASAIQRTGHYVYVFDEGSSGAGRSYVVQQNGTSTYSQALRAPGISRADVGKIYTVRQTPLVMLTAAAIYEVHS